MAGKERIVALPPELLKSGEIPSIFVWGKTVPEAWENAVLGLLDFGCPMRTEYDLPEDPPSKDSTMMVTVASPMEEPRIHRCFPDSVEGLMVYVAEVVDGVHNHWVRDGGWSYSYHDRLVNWPGVDGWSSLDGSGLGIEFPHINQLEMIAQKLTEVPYTRRAQAITWNPLNDAGHHEPPCLQRVWGRLVQSEGNWLFEMNTHWRSRDIFKGALMNMVAITELQAMIAQRISEKMGKAVGVGRYVEAIDSAHIYGSYLRRDELTSFLQAVEKRTFEQRTYRSDSPLIMEAREAARKIITEEKKQDGR